MIIKSKIKEGLWLHKVIKKSEIPEVLTQNRFNICPQKEPLQFAIIKANAGHKFAAHYHKKQPRHINLTQEIWIVIQGKVKVVYYDLDNSVLDIAILEQGDVTITFEGGHEYIMLDQDTIIYEIKNGPYYGRELDKESIL